MDPQQPQHTPFIHTDPRTGASKQCKLARFDLMPPKQLYELAEHYGKGVVPFGKYPERNWERGLQWSQCYSAMMRHLMKFWNGQDYDECPVKDDGTIKCGVPCTNHSGSKHLIAVAWHALTLANYMDTHPTKDDRPSTMAHID